jgi:hypothetical protein
MLTQALWNYSDSSFSISACLAPCILICFETSPLCRACSVLELTGMKNSLFVPPCFSQITCSRKNAKDQGCFSWMDNDGKIVNFTAICMGSCEGHVIFPLLSLVRKVFGLWQQWYPAKSGIIMWNVYSRYGMTVSETAVQIFLHGSSSVYVYI